jgi:hypothetical protein
MKRAGETGDGAGRLPRIEVALATYESERFLAELLDSLFAQGEQGFTLLVADDGSRDGTISILEDYVERFPGRIRIVARERQDFGPLGNFARLIDMASADYLMLCDHDDVWLPDKIARSLARMAELEREYGSHTPLLVHTDLIVADENLEAISPSLFEYSNIDPTKTNLVSLLRANCVTGCTLLANRALYEKARPIPREAVMHDHWMVLVAATFGAIGCVDEPTILYRQHGGNALGAPRRKTFPLIQRIRQTLLGEKRQRVMRRHSGQARALLRRYGHEMSTGSRRAAEVLATIWEVHPWLRFGRLRRSGFRASGFLRNAALFVVVTRCISVDERDGAG